MKKVAIITARGGSKRIPRKNIRNFCGYPIISYSIKAALESGCFDEVMVSTDDKEISEISQKYGAKIPFLRSEKNSNDYATTADVILEVISSYQNFGKNFDYFCCIYPTAVFVTAEKLKKAQDLLISSMADSLVPVARFSFPIQRAVRIKNGLIEYFWPNEMDKRSQDLEESFHDCGQFYFAKTNKFLESKKLFTDNTIALEMKESEVQDIDNEEDWRMAEIKFKVVTKLTP